MRNRVRNPEIAAVEPLLDLSPCPIDRFRALKDSRIRYDPEESGSGLPRRRDAAGFAHLVARLAFRPGEYFPSVIQIREIALPQIDCMSSERLLGNDGLAHPFESVAKRFVDDLLQCRLSPFVL